MSKAHFTQHKEIVERLGYLLEIAQQHFHRQCMILSGEKSWCQDTLQKIASHFTLNNTLIVSSTPTAIDDSTTTTVQQALFYIGHEFNHAVIDCFDGIDPNALGAVAGTISGGGVMIIIIPTLDQLAEFDDPEKLRMVVWPKTKADVGNRFLQRLRNIIHETKSVTLVQQNALIPEPVTDYQNPDTRHEYLQNDACRTTEQREAVNAVIHTVEGHRRRPLVITASRGRGKSAALGIAAAQLMLKGAISIIVTGPRQSAVAMVFKHASKSLPNAELTGGGLTSGDACLEYVAPDILCDAHRQCGLLLVDEAAAIPAAMLERLLDSYSRIVFATTTYGYEGTGRGFAIKFRETLNAKTPGWRQQEMHLPIRWAPDDPLEQFLFRLLRLDATIPDIEPAVAGDNVVVKKINRDDLVCDEATLSSIFALLVLAHYQTQPRDLRYLLDGINIDIHVALYQDRVVGTAIVVQEGELDDAIAEAVFRNERRVHGHLLPQTLGSILGMGNAAGCRYLRVIRIAVHPKWQRTGVGSALLRNIETDANNRHIDIVGSNFGASRDVMQFWQMNHYLPVHLGLKQNLSHGGHSITYLKSLSENGSQITESVSARFKNNFPYLLGECYQDVDYELVCDICSTLRQDSKLSLSAAQWNDIVSYANSLRGYELNAPAIHQLVCFFVMSHKIDAVLEASDTHLLILKVLQRKSWKDVVAECGFSGKKVAAEKLRQAIKKIISAESVKRSIVVTR